jgi:general secretion pathway protein M
MGIKLNRREKYLTAFSAGVILLTGIAYFVVFPYLDKIEKLDRAVQVKTRTLSEMSSVKAEYETIRKITESAKDRFSKREKGFTLFSFLDRLAGKAGVKDHIAYMKPTTATQKGSPYKVSLVEMKLDNVTLEQLTFYLHMVETSENMVSINRISISKAGKQESYLTAIFQVETFEI